MSQSNQTDYVPDQAWWDLLRSVDTPTVCNAIEVVQGKRGFDNFSHGTMLAAVDDAPSMVGYARTARIRALTPPDESPDVIKARRMAYYKYMSEATLPSVVVIEDTDYPNCIGAFWGEVNTAIHGGFGLAGTLTNGVMRDLGDLEPGYQVIAGSIGPSHGFVHVLDYDEPVSFMGMSVKPGDMIHADRHGAVVIPADVVPELQKGIETLLASEKIVLGPARESGFNFEKFEAAWAAFEKART